MIKRMHIENFKCFREFDIELDRFNVLVGPNGSGKTAFLQAITIANRIQQAPAPKFMLPEAELESRLGIVLGSEAVWQKRSGTDWRIDLFAKKEDASSELWKLQIGLISMAPRFVQGCLMPMDGSVSIAQGAKAVLDEILGQVACFRLSPPVLKEPCELRDDQAGMDEDGGGMAAFLDSMSRRDRDAFRRLEAEFCSRFPEFEQIVLMTGPIKSGKVGLSVGFRMRHGYDLSAGSVSDGTILSLAFLAACYQPSPPGILLVEEPENGVHPCRLKEIVDTLKHLSEDKGVQVILTTHSPYLLDLVRDEEVYVFQKDEEDAAHVRKLSEFDDVAEMRKNFMTGEIWSILAETQGI